MQRTTYTTAALLCTLACTSSISGCNQSTFADIRQEQANDDPNGNEGGPGGRARDDANIDCEFPEDCGAGETCVDNICQMQRCQDGPYSSAPPMSANIRLYQDREFVVADTREQSGEFYIDSYETLPGTVEYPGSYNIGSTAARDVAGGDFFGRNPELFVVATAGSTELKLGGVEENIHVDVGFPAIAVAAGDVDSDGMDEAFALSRNGNWALCDMDTQSCSDGYIQNATAKDAGIGDVDGDGEQEVVLLLGSSSGDTLMLLEVGGSQAGEIIQAPANRTLVALDVGDPDGDRVASVFGVQDDGPFEDAQLVTYSASGGAITEVARRTIDGDTIDLSLGDLDLDDQDEVLLLREGRVVEVLRGAPDSTALSADYTHTLSASNAPERIAAVDFDGDSPRTRLVNTEPQLLPGQVVPLVVGIFPPYEAEFSDGEAAVSIGRADSSSESFSDTVSLEAGLDVAWSVGLADILSVGLGVKLRQSIRFTETDTFKTSIGTRYSARPESYFEGEPYAVVSLTCGCFHTYYYEVDDPMGMLGSGAHLEQFVLTVPVGGSELLWSTRRYNAMAERVGNLPLIEVPYQVGNPSSYPSGPERLNGEPIATDDFVFTEPPSIVASDAGSSGFRLSIGEAKSNSVATSTSISGGVEVSGGIPFVGGSKVAASVGAGWGEGYRITVGETAFFGGSIPPLPDNPSTPEDEYSEHAYTTLPFVYREHYQDNEGNDAGYYVISYAVVDQ